MPEPIAISKRPSRLFRNDALVRSWSRAVPFTTGAWSNSRRLAAIEIKVMDGNRTASQMPAPYSVICLGTGIGRERGLRDGFRSPQDCRRGRRLLQLSQPLFAAGAFAGAGARIRRRRG